MSDKISTLFAETLRLHQAGRLTDTEVLYPDKILTPEERVRTLYESQARSCDANDFQGQVFRNPWGKPVGAEQVEMIVSAISAGLEIRHDDVLLDLACGNGVLTDAVFRMCQGGVGVDITPYLIEVAKKHFEWAPSSTYEVGDVAEYVETAERPGRFTKVMFYGAFQLFSTPTAAQILAILHARFASVSRIFIGNMPELGKEGAFFGEKVPPLHHLRRSDTPGGLWRTPEEFTELAGKSGWQAAISRMPPNFYSAGFRFDATLTRMPGEPGQGIP